ncbi:unnamed protein product [Caenorhabditis auriculariae]|uniref:MAD homolog n=1 Tax=Caenorhabditis auriculariae TaxID=2777116 RepID=A0A8S1HA65_9PELO|nr:unnamed protein product [Caenorhabditis auriculariae]
MDLLDLYHAHDLSLETEYDVEFKKEEIVFDNEASTKQSTPEGKKVKKPKFVPWEPYKAAPSADRRGECPEKLPQLIAYPSEKVQKINNNNENEVETKRLVDMRRLRQEQSIDEASHTDREMRLEDELNKVREELTIEKKLNQELRRLMVATLSDELQGQVEALTEDKVRLAHRVDEFMEKLMADNEEAERLRIDCDVWKCKFLAQSIRCDELNGKKEALLRALLNAQRIVRDSNATTEEALTFASADLQPLFARTPCEDRVRRPAPRFSNVTVACCKSCAGREIILLPDHVPSFKETCYFRLSSPKEAHVTDGPTRNVVTGDPTHPSPPRPATPTAAMSSDASVASSSAPFFPADAASYADASHGLMSLYPQMTAGYPANLLCSMPPQYFNYSMPGQGLLGPAPDVQFAFNAAAAAAMPSHAYQSLLQLPTVTHAVSPTPVASASASSSHSMTSAVDSCQQIAHVLQCYQQGGEDTEFVRKAIESLVKKLKDKRVELDALITAVTSAGKQPTCCVTIQRSLDGRLQVANRKGVPHVVYARIWRWPNVNKNELVKLAQCQTPCDHQDHICINPYHYERVVSSGMSSLEVKGLNVEMPTAFKTAQSSASAASSAPDFLEMDFADSVQHQGFGEWPPGSSKEIFGCEGRPQTSWNFPSSSGFANQQLQFPQMIDLNQIAVPPSSQPLEHWCSIIYYELDTQIGETFKASTTKHPKVVVDGGMNPHSERAGRFCLGALSNVHRTEASEKARIHIGSGIELHALPDGNVTLSFTRPSNSPPSRCKIFVRSGFLDFCHGVEYGSKVHRFTASNQTTTVFDLRWAFMQMNARSKTSNEAVRAQAAAVAGYVRAPQMSLNVVPDSGVDRMRRDFCTIAISFVKGWGDQYHRKSIKETPCWIEVQLHRPLQLLDQATTVLPKNERKIGRSCSVEQIPTTPSRIGNIGPRGGGGDTFDSLEPLQICKSRRANYIY